MNDPSVIPPGGRALERAEREALLDELTDIVASSYLFKSLDDDGRRELIESGYVLHVPSGRTVMAQGAEGDTRMYLVLHGEVSVETTGGPTGSIHLAELGRGACVGEVSALTGGPRTATVKAIDDVQLVAFEQHRIERIIDAHPKVRELLEAMIEGRARDTVEKLIRS
ncbi:MAG TPA: cyclic nucleotide-binding domain-containing protein [Sandaracinaceae bacterium LLY-WYZ-13_1]|nr:cyclic nucleotide-binding domain-containing protein [Sandaracinaceae bacterium LLY-WYZ-13_1]